MPNHHDFELSSPSSSDKNLTPTIGAGYSSLDRSTRTNGLIKDSKENVREYKDHAGRHEVAHVITNLDEFNQFIDLRADIHADIPAHVKSKLALEYKKQLALHSNKIYLVWSIVIIDAIKQIAAIAHDEKRDEQLGKSSVEDFFNLYGNQCISSVTYGKTLDIIWEWDYEDAETVKQKKSELDAQVSAVVNASAGTQVKYERSLRQFHKNSHAKVKVSVKGTLPPNAKDPKDDKDKQELGFSKTVQTTLQRFESAGTKPDALLAFGYIPYSKLFVHPLVTELTTREEIIKDTYLDDIEKWIIALNDFQEKAEFFKHKVHQAHPLETDEIYEFIADFFAVQCHAKLEELIKLRKDIVKSINHKDLSTPEKQKEFLSRKHELEISVKKLAACYHALEKISNWIVTTQKHTLRLFVKLNCSEIHGYEKEIRQVILEQLLPHTQPLSGMQGGAHIWLRELEITTNDQIFIALGFNSRKDAVQVLLKRIEHDEDIRNMIAPEIEAAYSTNSMPEGMPRDKRLIQALHNAQKKQVELKQKLAHANVDDQAALQDKLNKCIAKQASLKVEIKEYCRKKEICAAFIKARYGAAEFKWVGGQQGENYFHTFNALAQIQRLKLVGHELHVADDTNGLKELRRLAEFSSSAGAEYTVHFLWRKDPQNNEPHLSLLMPIDAPPKLVVQIANNATNEVSDSNDHKKESPQNAGTPTSKLPMTPVHQTPGNSPRNSEEIPPKKYWWKLPCSFVYSLRPRCCRRELQKTEDDAIVAARPSAILSPSHN